MEIENSNFLTQEEVFPVLERIIQNEIEFVPNPISIDDGLQKVVGLDSIEMVCVIVKMEEIFDVAFSETVEKKMKTVKNLVDFVLGNINSEDISSIREKMSTYLQENPISQAKEEE